MTDAAKTRAQQLLGDTAPELVRLTNDVLFGQVWAGPGPVPAGPQPDDGGRPGLAVTAIAELKKITEG